MNAAELSDADLLQKTRQYAGTLSYYRAGWDNYANPQSVKDKERSAEQKTFDRLGPLVKECARRGLEWNDGGYLISKLDVDVWCKQ